MLIEVKKENEKAWKLIKNRKCCTITAFTSILPTRNYPILPQIEIAKISTNLTF
ncbi:RNA polymerase [Carp edema virus]|nr:RNA polymerase [Carp edema virus]